MAKPDPYGDWVLFNAKEGENQSPPLPDEELVAAAREAWPRALTHAKRELASRGLAAESKELATEVWEQVLRSMARTRRRSRHHHSPISDLQSYLFGAFIHRFNRAILREQKRLDTVDLVASAMDLERIESAQDATWVEKLERAIAVKQITSRMDPWTRKVWQAREYGYSWKEIAKWLGVTEQQAKMKFQYGLKKTRANIVRLLKAATPKKSG